MKPLTLVVATAGLSVLAGCAATPGPDEDEGKSLSQRLLDRQNEYCATASPARRAILLALIRSQVPMYPESGLCTDAEQALAAELARQLEGAPTVDIEQATRDQERARERNAED